MILIPYTEVETKQRQHLKMEGHTPDYKYVGEDTRSYYRVLKKYWERGEGFILLEHDVYPWPGALQQMDECPEPWCAYQYLYPPVAKTFVTGIGCMKFSSEAIASNPTMFDEANTIQERGEAALDWQNLDGWIVPELKKSLKRDTHIHTPPVVHLKTMPGRKPFEQ